MKISAAPFLLLLIFPFYVISSITDDGDREDYQKCDMALETWAAEALQRLSDLPDKDRHELKELLYFLHVPRTGGRTLDQCLLRHLFPRQQMCMRSYEHLRYNASTHCRLLVSHDDYSVLENLPIESTSVITNIRDPVDRVFSAYEFTLQASLKFLTITVWDRANDTNNAAPTRKPRRKLAQSTLNIWPWKYLVPWMRKDIYRRYRAAYPSEDEDDEGSLNASSFAMPMHDFIYHPIVIDLIHNGATFQLAGLTNNSYNEGAWYLRKCVMDYPDLGHYVLDVAKRRLSEMTFVGLTEKHKDSATLFAHLIGEQVLPLGQPLNNSSSESNSKTAAAPLAFEGESMLSPSDPAIRISALNIAMLPSKIDLAVPLPVESPKENVTVFRLIEMYENCGGYTHHRQMGRNEKRSKRKPIPYKAREEVAENIWAAIRHMNSLDLELHNYAQQLFKAQVLRYRGSESVIQRSGKKIHESQQLILDERLYWWSSTWSVPRESVMEMFLCMSGGLVTLGLILYVFCNGSRKVFRARVNPELHEKI